MIYILNKWFFRNCLVVQGRKPRELGSSCRKVGVRIRLKINEFYQNRFKNNRIPSLIILFAWCIFSSNHELQ